MTARNTGHCTSGSLAQREREGLAKIWVRGGGGRIEEGIGRCLRGTEGYLKNSVQFFLFEKQRAAILAVCQNPAHSRIISILERTLHLGCCIQLTRLHQNGTLSCQASTPTQIHRGLSNSGLVISITVYLPQPQHHLAYASM